MLKNILKFSFFNYLVLLLIGFISNFLYLSQSLAEDNKNIESHSLKYKTTYVVDDKAFKNDLEELKQNNEKIIKKYFDLKIGSFYENVADEEKSLVYAAYKENYFLIRMESQELFYRFNRMEKQPFVKEMEKKKRELEIQKILDQCVDLIGYEMGDNLQRLNQQQGDPNHSIYDYFNDLNTDGYKKIEINIQLNYLNSRVYKCRRYLYDNDYSFSSFEYSDEINELSQSKKTTVEQLYTQSYLMIKAAGLLRYMEDAYYPKLLIREHANKTGLTKYIQEKEQISNHSLNHIDLAKEYFGSYENWSKSLNSFINQKMERYK